MFTFGSHIVKITVALGIKCSLIRSHKRKMKCYQFYCDAKMML